MEILLPLLMVEPESNCIMYCVCEYDEACDLAEVDQFGFIDLTEAMTTGEVSPNVTIDDLRFDGDIESPDGVGRRVKNAFDAMDNLNRIAPSE